MPPTSVWGFGFLVSGSVAASLQISEAGSLVQGSCSLEDSLVHSSVDSSSLGLAPSSADLGSGASDLAPCVVGSGSGALDWAPCGVVDLGFCASDLAPSAVDLAPCAVHSYSCASGSDSGASDSALCAVDLGSSSD